MTVQKIVALIICYFIGRVAFATSMDAVMDKRISSTTQPSAYQLEMK